MPFKKPSELSDQDLRGAVCFLLLRYQEMEMTLAEVTMLVLHSMDEVEEPTEGELRNTLSDLKQFLADSYERLKSINDTTDQLKAEEFSKN